MQLPPHAPEDWDEFESVQDRQHSCGRTTDEVPRETSVAVTEVRNSTTDIDATTILTSSSTTRDRTTAPVTHPTIISHTVLEATTTTTAHLADASNEPVYVCVDDDDLDDRCAELEDQGYERGDDYEIEGEEEVFLAEDTVARNNTDIEIYSASPTTANVSEQALRLLGNRPPTIKIAGRRLSRPTSTLL